MSQETLDLFSQVEAVEAVEEAEPVAVTETETVAVTESEMVADTQPAADLETAAELELVPKVKPQRRSNARAMAKGQRAISISEFFTKNRHLLGFDNPSKALLTAVREAVDNALDAAEEAGILPDVTVEISAVEGHSDRYRLLVRDLGPGIIKRQIGKIFGKLLYGSKFHRLKQSRGQQGIGISAAGMYAQITTGRDLEIISKTGARRPANRVIMRIDTKLNEPMFKSEEEIEWEYDHGTQIVMVMAAVFKGGKHGIGEFLRQTALSNPHARFEFQPPRGERIYFERQVDELPAEPVEIQPHPHGVELGILMRMMHDTKLRNLTEFLCTEFCRVSERVAEEMITDAAKLIPDRQRAQLLRRNPKQMQRHEAEALYEVMQATKLMSPPTNCLSPIGPEAMMKGLFSLFDPGGYDEDEFFVTSETRAPAVYRGNPFQVEVGIVHGKGLLGDTQAEVFRFANRVPLQYQFGACAVTRAITSMNWRQYHLQQPRGGLPVGPMVVAVHIASGWMPYTSESKEAIAHYPEILAELRLALQVCARRLAKHIKKKKRALDELKKRAYITNYVGPIAEALDDILNLPEGETDAIKARLEEIITETRGGELKV
jgi:DNA topoisomerase-6 subunit B